MRTENIHCIVMVSHTFLVGTDGGGCEIPTYDSDTPAGSSGQGYQLLSWDQYQPDQWCTLYNSRYENL